MSRRAGSACSPPVRHAQPGHKVPAPERAPYGTLGARRLYGDVRVLLPVPLKPPNLVRRTGGNLLHGASIATRQAVHATAY